MEVETDTILHSRYCVWAALLYCIVCVCVCVCSGLGYCVCNQSIFRSPVVLAFMEYMDMGGPRAWYVQ